MRAIASAWASCASSLGVTATAGSTERARRDVGVPEVLRAFGVGLPAPDALDVGIAPDRAPASRERARLRPAPQTREPADARPSMWRARHVRKSNKRPFGKNRDVPGAIIEGLPTSDIGFWRGRSALRGGEMSATSRRPPRDSHLRRSRPLARAALLVRVSRLLRGAHAVAGVFFVFRGLGDGLSAELAAAKRAVLEAVDGTSRGLRCDDARRAAAERAISALERLNPTPAPAASPGGQLGGDVFHCAPPSSRSGAPRRGVPDIDLESGTHVNRLVLERPTGSSATLSARWERVGEDPSLWRVVFDDVVSSRFAGGSSPKPSATSSACGTRPSWTRTRASCARRARWRACAENAPGAGARSRGTRTTACSS